jgi:hypothetical protein
MKSLMSKYLLPIVAVAAVGLAAPAFATSGETTAAIENSFVVSTVNFPQSPGDFLITLAGYDSICPKSGFAYLLETDSYYTGTWELLNVARVAGKAVKVYWTTDANGYCHITSAAEYCPTCPSQSDPAAPASPASIARKSEAPVPEMVSPK